MRPASRLPLALLFLVLSALFACVGCAKSERWTAIVYAGETSFNHRNAGEYATVQECLAEGKEVKGEGYLECGLNCRYDAQGLFQCDKLVRLMEHQ
jgi:hypothetical protein